MNPRCPSCLQETKDGMTQLNFSHENTKVIVSEIPAKMCACGYTLIQGDIAMDLDEHIQEFYNKIADVRKYYQKT